MEAYKSYEEYITKNPKQFQGRIGKITLRRLEPKL